MFLSANCRKIQETKSELNWWVLSSIKRVMHLNETMAILFIHLPMSSCLFRRAKRSGRSNTVVRHFVLVSQTIILSDVHQNHQTYLKSYFIERTILDLILVQCLFLLGVLCNNQNQFIYINIPGCFLLQFTGCIEWTVKMYI